MNKKFDIFISFKATDKGAVTGDVAEATALYRALVERGYSVFFSSETIAKGGSSDFSKEIDAALDAAKVLIVVSSKVEYVNSRWVEYEWKSFHADILSNVKSDAQIITFTDGIDTRELPRILRYVQNFGFDARDSLLSLVDSIFQQAPSSFANAAPVVAKTAANDHTVYDSASGGEYEILRIRAGKTYRMDMDAVKSVKSEMNLKKYTVLVLGCAYGLEAETRFGLDDDVETVICLDKNAGVLERARELYRDYPHMKFYQVNVEGDEYEADVRRILSELSLSSVDIVYVSDLFRYLNNPAKTVRATRKLLQKDGHIIIRDCDDSNKLAYPDQKGVLDAITKSCESLAGMPNYYIGRELPLLLQNGGFAIRDVRLDIQSTINLSFDEKEEFFLSTFGSRKNIAGQIAVSDPALDKDAARLCALVDQMEELFYEGNFWYSESNLAFIAKKA